MESTWGPEGAGPSDAAAQAQPGEGTALNPSTAADALDLYLSEIADLLALQHGLDDETSAAMVYDVADELGMPIPDEDAPEQEVAMWLGQAKTKMFATEVLKKASEAEAE
jgi:hypothetical protein